MTTFLFQETAHDGEPKGEPLRYTYHEIRTAIALRCPRMARKRLEHFIDLAMASIGTEVDVTHWERGALNYSARLKCVQNSRPKGPVIFLPQGGK